ncbi:MAG: ABC transporter ATP-binding protein [Chitinispirillales bacterium]|jgi:oligopeptide/dipeptide ABC transporter ATP-binding protein|nr:ABC transporter ATP-binding protein [Chitinispirillales bacterium]
MPCLSCNDLKVSFRIQKKSAYAVRGVSFSVGDRRTLGIVGESGCGKSVTAAAIMRLVPTPPGKIESGSIRFEEKELLAIPEKEMCGVRGRRISMVFQDPMTSLNPVFTCGYQTAEPLILHKGMDKRAAAELSMELFSEVGIAEPKRVFSSYPHNLSGGMRQRVMIAMALACSPRLLIADEPTTALDVTVQARLLELLKKLQDTKDMSMILITHNLGIVTGMAHDVIVMYAGEIVESAPAQALFESPRHPYTECLLKTIPSIERRGERLTVIPGTVPTPLEVPEGCPFHPRCPKAKDVCKKDHPPLHRVDGGGNGVNIDNDGDNGKHHVRCHLYE